MHPYVTQALAAEQISGWQQQAARTRLARQAGRARRGRMSAADRLPPLHSHPIPTAQLVTGWGDVAEGRPGAANERRPAGTRAA
jgi:hypothetical protein